MPAAETKETIQVSDDAVRRGAIFRCTHEAEGAPPLVEVENRLYDVDQEVWKYELTCPTHTWYSTYREEDFGPPTFEDTSMTKPDGCVKPIEDEEIRERYQELCNHSSWVVVHDRETDEAVGERCVACQVMKEEVQA